jgi:YD repeat-containing protein
MVGIFTSLGAGMERGSVATLGATGLIGSKPVGRGGDTAAINARNGNLMISRQDEFLVGLGLDAASGRTYNSQGALEENGDHWRIHDDRRIVGLTGGVNSAYSTVRRVSADGSEITYTMTPRAGRWSYWSTDGNGAHDELSFTNNQWTWTEGGTGIQETYEDFGGGTWRLKQQIDTRQGSTLTYAYHADGRIYTVATSDGGWIRYDWAGNYLTQIVTGFLNTQTQQRQERTSTSYAYDAYGRLSQVHVNLTRTDGQGGGTYTTSYEYHGLSRQVAHLIQSDGSNTYFGYDALGRVWVVSQLISPGNYRNTTIEYINADRTDIIDFRGARTVLNHNAAGRLTSVIEPAPASSESAATTTFQYDGDGNVTAVTGPTGGVSLFSYDDRGNHTSTNDATGRATIRDYDASNRLIAERSWGARASGPSDQLVNLDL